MQKTKIDKNKMSKESMEEDFKAIRKVLSGNNNAFDYLQKKYKKIIASLIRRMVKDEDDVDDLTQETFIKAYNALNSFQFGYSFSSWLYKIASNNCIDFLRKKRFPTISLSQPVSGDDEDQTYEIADESYIADGDVLSMERKKVLYSAIDSLPENYREIIRLRHEEDLDYNEISDKLQLPLGTVKAHLFRARKILYTQLKSQVHLFNESL